MSVIKKGSFYTVSEEIANAVTHGVGSCWPSSVLFFCWCGQGGILCIVSSSIYGASMILLFTMSCLYHAITNVRAKKVLRVFDHSTIFCSSPKHVYPPIPLISLRGPSAGQYSAGIVWAWPSPVSS